MSDKEPRRRKKRKDVQRKDDVRTEEQIFQPTKSEPRDSDQEQEEEFVIPTHQPSKFAKLVFMLLFSGLVISMSFIFISLQGADRGPVDIFDVSHVEEHEEASHDIHEEAESWSPPESFQESLGDFLPDIGNILSLNDEEIRETEEVLLENVGLDSSENLELKDSLEDLESDASNPESEEPESITDQGIIEKYIEDIEESILDVPREDVTPSDLFTESVVDSPVTEEKKEEYFSDFLPDTSQASAFIKYTDVAQETDYLSSTPETDYVSTTPETEHVSLTPETEHISTTPKTEHVSTTPETEHISTTQETKYVSTFLPEDDDDQNDYISTTVPYTDDSVSMFTTVAEDELQRSIEQTPFPEELEENDDDEYALYDKADITNRADFEIRDHLDDFDKIVEKETSEDDDFDDDDDDDEEQSQDEFDFWQF